MEEITKELCVRGYHVYKEIWTAVLGETLPCVRETSNEKDRYAVAVIKDSNIVGHLPKKISSVSSLFLRRGGTITCTVTGRRRCSVDLVQGGLEIPCILTFRANKKEIEKLKKIMNW